MSAFTHATLPADRHPPRPRPQPPLEPVSGGSTRRSHVCDSLGRSPPLATWRSRRVALRRPVPADRPGHARRPHPARQRSRTFVVENANAGGWNVYAISAPMEMTLVYQGRGEASSALREAILRRPLDALEATPIQGTEGARNTVDLADDSEWLAFYTSATEGSTE